MKESYYTQYKKVFPDQETQNEELAKRFPVKRGRDHGKTLTTGDIANALGDLIDKGASIEEMTNYLDSEFLFGAWDHELKYIIDYLCLFDIRSLIIRTYKVGKERGAKDLPKF